MLTSLCFVWFGNFNLLLLPRDVDTHAEPQPIMVQKTIGRSVWEAPHLSAASHAPGIANAHCPAPPATAKHSCALIDRVIMCHGSSETGKARTKSGILITLATRRRRAALRRASRLPARRAPPAGGPCVGRARCRCRCWPAGWRLPPPGSRESWCGCKGGRQGKGWGAGQVNIGAGNGSGCFSLTLGARSSVTGQLRALELLQWSFRC